MKMTKGIIHKIGTSVESDITEPFHEFGISDEQPTVADLVIPGTGHAFSSEFACLLKILAGGRELV
jgi:hypothetical protein